MSGGATGPSLQQLPTTWDAVAPTYAADVGQWKDYAEEALRALHVSPTARVLDVACGPGTLALMAAKRAARVDAVDFSPGMIAELEQRASEQGLGNVSTRVMDASALDFPDQSFDAAFCLFAFFFFPDRHRAFLELRRVLAPGGRALIATWAPIERRPVMKLAFDAVAEALPSFPRPTKGDLQDPSECVAEMSAAGFAEVKTHAFTAKIFVESPERYLELIVRSAAPFAVMRKKLGEEVWRDNERRLLEALRPRIPAAGLELSAEALITVGTRAS
jgi:ubiquinone/menaquinone biosynthesis C-methylase UbiE